MSYFILLFAHFLGDYPLQGEYLAKTKGKNTMSLIAHAAIWTGTVSLAGYFIGFTITFVDVFSLFIIHAVADYWKANKLGIYKKLNPESLGLALDQAIHGVQLIIFILVNSNF